MDWLADNFPLVFMALFFVWVATWPRDAKDDALDVLWDLTRVFLVVGLFVWVLFG